MKARTIFRILLWGTAVLALLAQAVPLAQAQTDQGAVVQFATLGETEILLDGPIDSTSIDFFLPAHWSLQAGTSVHLNMRAFIGTTGDFAGGNSTAGFVEVYLNDTWLQTIPLDHNGDYSIDVSIPYTAWDLTQPHAPQSLRIYLHDAVRCGLLWASAQSGTWRGINVAVSPTSYLVLPHEEIPVPTDLRSLPYPIYQSSFLPEQALVIVPSEPTDAELQAGLTISAALGRMTDGRLKTTFMTANQVTPVLLSQAHAIFIGGPADFPQLAQATLPAPVQGNGFAIEAGPDDGILQMAVSPVNPAMAWLVISGNSAAGIIKAAQAFGSQQVRIYGPQNLSIVTEVTPQPDPALIADVTLGDLGYDEQTYSGYGITYFAYWFDVPANFQITDGAFFEMLFNNSALLNYDESGISVILNDQFVGGVRMSDRTTSVSSTKFSIPAYMFQAGRNLLLLEVNLTGITPCIPYEEIWVSIKPGSLLHMPSLPLPVDTAPVRNLTDYPSRLFPTFDGVAFLLPRDDPGAWQIAAGIAYQTGITSGGTVIAPLAAYADAIPDGLLQTSSLILVGRPSALPVLANLSTALPAPFAAGTDIASEPGLEFLFDVPDTVPVGYLQVLPSPWNPQRVILAVNGNNDAGMLAASQTLADSNQRANLHGNLAVIYDHQVLVTRVDPQTQTVAPPVVTMLATPTAPADAESGPFQIDLVTVGLIMLAIIIVLAVIIWVTNRRKGSGNKKA